MLSAVSGDHLLQLLLHQGADDANDFQARTAMRQAGLLVQGARPHLK
jgi:hypothetical protein